MKYTLQLHSDSGNFAAPDGRQSLSHWRNRRDVYWKFEHWAELNGRYNARSDAMALVWCGEHLTDTTDVYPDFQLRLGPRGGILWEPC